MWALSSANLLAPSSAILEALREKAATGSDPYQIALAAGALYNTNQATLALPLATRLVQFLQEDGSVGGSTTSITSSSGDPLTVETTRYSNELVHACSN